MHDQFYAPLDPVPGNPVHHLFDFQLFGRHFHTAVRHAHTTFFCSLGPAVDEKSFEPVERVPEEETCGDSPGEHCNPPVTAHGRNLQSNGQAHTLVEKTGIEMDIFMRIPEIGRAAPVAETLILGRQLPLQIFPENLISKPAPTKLHC